MSLSLSLSNSSLQILSVTHILTLFVNLGIDQFLQKVKILERDIQKGDSLSKMLKDPYFFTCLSCCCLKLDLPAD